MTLMCLQRSFNRLPCHSSTSTCNEVAEFGKAFSGCSPAWLRKWIVPNNLRCRTQLH
ncbi:hypothetical protein K443DRAFT_439133 [Laccaria amethystina LaAM-08-1]|uniref:Uncharacterized protein n=1 Tax=Laccaria amethystina LaAM-08-1 TaxID=1095629 RepID=A0A0C9WNW0_9AGAR|nr:hypothetical protein K443DRAFT_439133 [Laccaria amethystina LaAM-08-1]